ncbi:DNA-binding Xre family transcriptional regulator [Rhizobium subbaraonis]|jgi:DNA-binding Xre family transcriptional regulator|uniref:DNA-binding Xre family transcriptional regulator n=1 Tax=Rhizobium subbaraonis TaxID=908946 RepID=A0A285UZ33_9HYPH|nr:XRE family transcriptional regulator [Agrobacterium sp. SUL3]TQN58207.1 helix-turn-helix transcriptional regulator [Agrobacterium tumefaciens]SOC45511.1 DNA-binding Xre family transcriptional regulator [Rhizobium subbaraonis]
MPRLKRQPPVEAVDISTIDTLSFQERLAIGLERLKAERKLTNRELAEQLGVHEAYISQVTRAMRDVKLSTLDKMQREWNVVIEDLLRITEADLHRIAVWKARRKKQRGAATDS